MSLVLIGAGVCDIILGWDESKADLPHFPWSKEDVDKAVTEAAPAELSEVDKHLQKFNKQKSTNSMSLKDFEAGLSIAKKIDKNKDKSPAAICLE